MSPALVVYTCIFVVGFGFLFLSFLTGIDHGMDLEHETEHPEDASHGTISPSFFSMKVISCFLMGAGLGAILSRTFLTGPHVGEFLSGYPVDLLFALIGGFAMGWLGWLIIKFFFSQQCDSTYSIERFKGEKCLVTVTIPKDGIGEISATLDGVSRTIDARNLVPVQDIPVGSVVVVSHITAGVGIVVKYSDPEK